jgi:hypothetical protein
MATGKARELAAGEMTITAGTPPGTVRAKCGPLAQIEHSAEQIAALAGAAALAHEVRDRAMRAMRAKGGRTAKRLPGIWARVRELVAENPRITVSQAWESFPMADHRLEAEGLIYRDGNCLVEVDDRTGGVRNISYDTFRGYLKAARKRLSSK